MSLEAIEAVNRAENENKARRAAAEQEAKERVAQAEKDGLALLERVRAQSAEEGKRLLREAEERAEKRCAQLRQDAAGECEAMERLAREHMSAAAERIVGKVVKQ